jgi:hypothetical protein
MSLQNWAERWKVSKDTARNFFTLLEKDSMILHEGLPKTTRITVCKYEDYQSDLHADTPKSTRRANATSPIKEREEGKEEKNIENANKLAARSTEFQKSLIPFIGTYKNEMLRKFADYWTESNPSKTKMKFELEKTWDTTKRLKKWADNETKFTKTTNETATEQTAGYKPIKFGTDK